MKEKDEGRSMIGDAARYNITLIYEDGLIYSSTQS